MKKLTLLALLLGLLTGCGAAKEATALPAAMPADFEIRYENWIDEAAPNIYDTGKRLLQKDLVDPDGQPTAQAELAVSDETRQAIYDQVRACALDRLGDEKLTAENLTTDDTLVAVTPLTEYRITFTADGDTYTVTGDATAWEYAVQDTRAARLYDFVQYMSELFVSSPAYQSLPEAQGAYM